MTEGLHTFAILSDSYLAGRRALKEPTSLRKSALCDVKNILQAKQTPNLPMKRLITTSKELTPCPKQRASDSTSLSSTILPDSPSQHDQCNCVDYEEYSVGIIRLESDCLRGQDIVCVKEGIFKVPNSEDSAPTCPQFPELEFSDADESFSFPAPSLDSYFFPVVVSLDDQYTFDFDDFEE